MVSWINGLITVAQNRRSRLLEHFKKIIRLETSVRIMTFQATAKHSVMKHDLMDDLSNG